MTEKAPKRVNSFVLYCRENRGRLKLKYPDLSSSQLTSLLAHNWKQEDKETRQAYIRKAELERDEFNKKRKVEVSDTPPITEFMSTFKVNAHSYKVTQIQKPNANPQSPYYNFNIFTIHKS